MKPEKHITLLAAGILVLAVFFLLPRNGRWMAERIVPYWQDLQKEENDLSLEHRKVQRYGKAYIFSRQIADSFPDKRTALVLLPPAAYCRNGGLDYPVPEPAIFYYFTGLKTVWAGSRTAMKANWIISIAQGQIHILPVTNGQQLADSIASFKKFSYEL